MFYNPLQIVQILRQQVMPFTHTCVCAHTQYLFKNLDGNEIKRFYFIVLFFCMLYLFIFIFPLKCKPFVGQPQLWRDFGKQIYENALSVRYVRCITHLEKSSSVIYQKVNYMDTTSKKTHHRLSGSFIMLSFNHFSSPTKVTTNLISVFWCN